MSDTLEITRADAQRADVVASDFMPVFSVQQAVERKKMVNQFISGVLVETEDYGTIPGTSTKKVLLKPGAEKLCSIFGLSVTYSEDKIIEDWTGAEHGGEPLFYYSYRCQLSRGGRFMGEAIGSCNSWESKYRYRWVAEEIAKQRADFDSLMKRGGVTTKFEPNFALDKKETTGRYAKTAEYWAGFEQAIKDGTAKNVRKKLGNKEYEGWEMTMDQTQYRIPNPEIADTINTCQKMAQKRSLVAAVLVVTNCSDAFTQDVEDFAEAQTESQREHTANGNRASESKPDGPTPDSGTRPPVPESLQRAFDRLRQGDPKAAVAREVGAMNDAMVAKGGKLGGDTYTRIVENWKQIHPKPTLWKPADIEQLLADLWDALEAIEPPSAEGGLF